MNFLYLLAPLVIANSEDVLRMSGNNELIGSFSLPPIGHLVKIKGGPLQRAIIRERLVRHIEGDDDKTSKAAVRFVGISPEHAKELAGVLKKKDVTWHEMYRQFNQLVGTFGSYNEQCAALNALQIFVNAVNADISKTAAVLMPTLGAAAQKVLTQLLYDFACGQLNIDQVEGKMKRDVEVLAKEEAGKVTDAMQKLLAFNVNYFE